VLGLGLCLSVGLLTVPLADPARAAVAGPGSGDQSVEVGAIDPAKPGTSETESWKPSEVVWPAATVAEAAVATTGESTAKIGDTPVAVGQAVTAAASSEATAADQPQAVVSRSEDAPVTRARVQILDRDLAVRAGVNGILFTVARSDGAQGSAGVGLDVDYSGSATRSAATTDPG
jgi:hypothetical protein